MPCLSNLPTFGHLNNIWCELKMMKLIIWFSPVTLISSWPTEVQTASRISKSVGKKLKMRLVVYAEGACFHHQFYHVWAYN
jgi:hypothetical protein